MEEVKGKTARQMVLKHLAIIQKAVDHATAGVATSREVVRGSVLVNRDNLILVLQLIARSRWACTDLLAHDGEEDQEGALGPAQQEEELPSEVRQLIEALYHALLLQEEVLQTAGDLLSPLHRPDLNREWSAARGRIARPVRHARNLVRQYERLFRQGRFLLADNADAQEKDQREAGLLPAADRTLIVPVRGVR